MISEHLHQHLLELDLPLSQAQFDLLEQYAQLLVEWNQRVNLTRIIEPRDIAIKHFLDSLTIFPFLKHLSTSIKLIDVGTGAGFPGLPLKIVQPELQLTLLETTRKKTDFLTYVVQTLSLSNVEVVTARAEDAGQQPQYRGQFDIAVARAVAALPVLIEYTLPFVKKNGTLLLQKGQTPTEEVSAAKNALKLLGGSIESVQPIELEPLQAERHLIIIRKTQATPKQYPRRAGLPSKKPL